jgi:PhzF family phenazine biosynthesis protein
MLRNPTTPARIKFHAYVDAAYSTNVRRVESKQMRIPLFHADAFTDRAFRGNPAAVCFLDFWLDDALLRKVATENNLPATAFLVPSPTGYALRWFSPVCELKLCGHATLAAAFVLFRFVSPQVGEVLFSTSRGGLRVQNGGDLLTMDFPAIAAKSCATTPELLSAVSPSLSAGDILETFAGNQTYVAVLASQAQIQHFQPDTARLEALHPEVVVITAPGDEVDFVSRYFAPGYGLPEDSVTGSSHCLIAPIWAERLAKSTLRARQLSARGGEMTCELKGDRVILQGKAVATLKGSLSL